MDTDNWIQRGYLLPSGRKAGRMIFSAANWQMYETSNDSRAIIVSEELYKKWNDSASVPLNMFIRINLACVSGYVVEENSEFMLSSVAFGPYPNSYNDALAFAIALRESRKLFPSCSFADALYLERYSLILPTYSSSEINDQAVLYRWLSSGVNIPENRFDRLCQITSWLHPALLIEIFKEAGFAAPDGASLSLESVKEDVAADLTVLPVQNSGNTKGNHFSLPGRPALESFFNEHVVDILLNAEKYKRMGIDFPGAIILHGPPGCGKTFAVEKLIEFLDLPSFYISSGSIGSPFIHDTSKKISEMFDSAIDNAPSVLVIDEMEAFLTDRSVAQASGQHHVEEVAEFLRRIPEAADKKVLVLAMTNLIDSIDPAILRRGRFDHIIEVKMPSKEEVLSLLNHLLEPLPTNDDLDCERYAAFLAGHPLSDVSYVIKEAGRLAVRNGKDAIDDDLFSAALDSLPKAGTVRKIGF